MENVPLGRNLKLCFEEQEQLEGERDFDLMPTSLLICYRECKASTR